MTTAPTIYTILFMELPLIGKELNHNVRGPNVNGESRVNQKPLPL